MSDTPRVPHEDLFDRVFRGSFRDETVNLGGDHLYLVFAGDGDDTVAGARGHDIGPATYVW